MDDRLIDDEGLSLPRKSQLPGTGFFYPDSLDEQYADRRTRAAVEGAEAVVVADTDADGLCCVAFIREAYGAALEVTPFEEALAARVGEMPATDADDAGAGEADAALADGEPSVDAVDDAEAGVDRRADERSSVALVGAGPHSLGDALSRVAEYAPPDADVYVCDLCPDRYESVADPVESLADRTTVQWFDHHQWADDVAAAVREAGVDLAVGDSDAECTADVALRSLDHEFPAHLRELAAVTRDHDLWIKEDDRSDDLADYSYWADAEEYVTVVGRYGPDLPDSVMAFVESRRVEKTRLIEQAVERAELRTVGPWTVGVTYGRCSQNEVAETLRERGADAAVVVKPAGSASIRGSETFERAHEVARQVNGGGHPRAAGCKPDIYDDMLDYAHHWTTQGSAAKRVILAAFERLIVKEDGDTESAADAPGGDAGEAASDTEAGDDERGDGDDG